MPEPLRWHFDRTGFPYLHLPGSDKAMSLLPLTKIQLENWLAIPDGPGDEWYLDLLTISPRGNWRTGRGGPIWQNFATALLPQEVRDFSAWLGNSYRLPDATEWRAADLAIQQLKKDDFANLMKQLEKQPGSAAKFLHHLTQQGRNTWFMLSLLQHGILEWVTRPHGEPGGLGRPMRELPIQLILDPQAFDPVTPLRSERHAAFGARLLYSPIGGFQ